MASGLYRALASADGVCGAVMGARAAGFKSWNSYDTDEIHPYERDDCGRSDRSCQRAGAIRRASATSTKSLRPNLSALSLQPSSGSARLPRWPSFRAISEHGAAILELRSVYERIDPAKGDFSRMTGSPLRADRPRLLARMSQRHDGISVDRDAPPLASHGEDKLWRWLALPAQRNGVCYRPGTGRPQHCPAA
jgi:hypothetical protein